MLMFKELRLYLPQVNTILLFHFMSENIQRVYADICMLQYTNYFILFKTCWMNLYVDTNNSVLMHPCSWKFDFFKMKQYLSLSLYIYTLIKKILKHSVSERTTICCPFWNGTIRFENEKFSFTKWFVSDRQWNQPFW